MKTIVVMPAYNASATLERTLADIPLSYVEEIILVDDASRDDTVFRARELIATHPVLTGNEEVYRRGEGRVLFTIEQLPRNRGYGGNQKKCYELALQRGAEIVIMLHPDYQYDPKLIKYFVEFIRDGYFDVMLGSRIRSREEALLGGMPPYKYYANRILSFIQNIASGRSLSEWHTGMRGYRASVLKALPYQDFSDDFVFDTQALFAIVERGFTIGDIPVPVRYFSEASSINFKRSVTYGTLTLWETIKFFVRTRMQFFRYVVAGVMAVLCNLALYSFLYYSLHVSYVYAAIAAFLAGMVISFSAHKYFTFKKVGAKSIPRELFYYILLVGINLTLNTLFLVFFVEKMGFHEFWSNVLSNALVALWSFFTFKYIAFRN